MMKFLCFIITISLQLTAFISWNTSIYKHYLCSFARLAWSHWSPDGHHNDTTDKNKIVKHILLENQYWYHNQYIHPSIKQSHNQQSALSQHLVSSEGIHIHTSHICSDLTYAPYHQDFYNMSYNVHLQPVPHDVEQQHTMHRIAHLDACLNDCIVHSTLLITILIAL